MLEAQPRMRNDDMSYTVRGASSREHVDEVSGVPESSDRVSPPPPLHPPTAIDSTIVTLRMRWFSRDHEVLRQRTFSSTTAPNLAEPLQRPGLG